MEELDTKRKLSKEEFIEYVSNTMSKGEFFVGAHGSRGNEGILQKIVDEGLSLRTAGNQFSGMEGTVTSYGLNEDRSCIEEASEYTYDRNGVIVSIPIALEHGENKTFIGYPEKTLKGLPKDQEDYKCCMTEMFDNLGTVPTNFILAYYITDENGDRTFILNEEHYLNLDSQRREQLYEEIMEKQSEDTKSEIERINAPDAIENTNNMKAMFETAGMSVSEELTRPIEQREKYEERIAKKEREYSEGIIPDMELISMLTKDVNTIGINEQVRGVRNLTNEKEREEEQTKD